MFSIKLGTAALNQTPLAWDHNRRNIEGAIDEARAQGVKILCLPELCITGYGCEDAFLSPSVHETAREVLAEIVRHTQDIIVSVGLPIFYRSGIYDAACLLANGRVLGCTAKRHLAGDGIHYEPRWFRAWPRGAHAEIELCGERIPFGDIVYRASGIGIGFEICEDAWVAERPGLDLVRRGVDIILNPSASHFAFGKHEIRRRFVLEGSRFLGVAYAYANMLGNEAGRAIYDGDGMIAAGGELRANCPRFSFADRQLTTASVDIDRCRMTRARSVSTEPSAQPHGGTTSFDFDFPAGEPEPMATPSRPHTPDSKDLEYSRATALGLFDYMRKSRSRGAVVSLSGGVDSAAVASLTSIMVDLALAELGDDGMREAFSYIPDLPTSAAPRDWVGRLLTTVYQSTANSSDTTRDAARGVAEAIGARHLEIDVDDLVHAYVDRVQEAIGRTLEWATDDIALQNIQARTRAPGVWLVANVHGALLLSTSNRSEAAVGYATMDGDTSGGLSPIAGIDKTYLRAWLRWLETEGGPGIRPIPALSAVNAQRPTAELRPPDQNQSDEDDLMPYPVLDAMERAAIRDKQSPVEVYERLRGEFGEDPQQLAQWVERFFRLWSRNQWKRERYAPSFHVDDENLDPKTWCRFPILSGGFEREIAELRAAVQPRSERGAS